MKGYTINAARVYVAASRLGGRHAAILTRYYGATDTRGARIVARLAGEGKRPRASIGYPYELDDLGRHTAAALALLDSMKHDGDGDAYALALVSAGAIVGGYAFTIGIASGVCGNCGDEWGAITRASGQTLCGECYGVWRGENPAKLCDECGEVHEADLADEGDYVIAAGESRQNKGV